MKLLNRAVVAYSIHLSGKERAEAMSRIVDYLEFTEGYVALLAEKKSPNTNA